MNGALELRPLYPSAILAVTGVVVLLAQAFTPKGRSAPSALLSLAGLAASLLTVWLVARDAPGATTGDSVVADDFAIFFHLLLLGIGIVVVLLSPAYLKANGLDRGEYYALLLFSIEAIGLQVGRREQ